ncbi:hypothetical protein ACHAWC_004059 [Mediolabrus comicus]
MKPRPAKKARKNAVDEEVVEEYAKYIKANSTRELVTVHVVNCLTRQYGNKFPVALNQGTRPRICTLLRSHLGDELYNNLCVSVSSDAGVALREDDDITEVVVPPLTRADGAASSSSSSSTVNATNKEIMRNKFPKNANLLLEKGAVRIPLLSQQEVNTIINSIHIEYYSSASNNIIRPAKLSVTQGNGKCGEYFSINTTNNKLLQTVIETTKEWIKSHITLSRPLGTKSILLRYGLGGVNYAHHDNIGDYQALLMLSQPGVDYDGGVFYLAESDPPHVVHDFPFGGVGELIVFCGRKEKYLHGMTEVIPGSAGEETTKRFAVGLFQ